MPLKTLLITFSLLLNLFALKAQHSAVITGGDIQGNNGSVAFSIGQPIYQIAGNGITSTEGVQQPIEIELVDVDTLIELEIQVYPNPTMDYIVIKVNDLTSHDLNYRIIDMKGALVSKAPITKIYNTINLMEISKAPYILQINDKNKEFKTYKIIRK